MWHSIGSVQFLITENDCYGIKLFSTFFEKRLSCLIHQSLFSLKTYIQLQMESIFVSFEADCVSEEKELCSWVYKRVRFYAVCPLSTQKVCWTKKTFSLALLSDFTTSLRIVVLLSSITHHSGPPSKRCTVFQLKPKKLPLAVARINHLNSRCNLYSPLWKSRKCSPK